MHASPPTISRGRKIRGDAKLACLNEEQQECLHHWLAEENRTYTQVADLVLANFGVTVSKSAVGMYYQRHILRERYDDDVDAAAELAALPIGEFDAATIKHAKALAFSALTSPFPQIDTASRLLDIVHRVHKQQVVDKRLALEERRVALREAQAAHPPRHTRATGRGTHAPGTSSPQLPASPTEPVPEATSAAVAAAVGGPPLPTPAPSAQEIPQNPPLFPASSSLNQPASPPQSVSPSPPPHDQPSVLTPVPAYAPAPKPTPPKPRIPYREPTRADWG